MKSEYIKWLLIVILCSLVIALNMIKYIRHQKFDSGFNPKGSNSNGWFCQFYNKDLSNINIALESKQIKFDDAVPKLIIGINNFNDQLPEYLQKLHSIKEKYNKIDLFLITNKLSKKINGYYVYHYDIKLFDESLQLSDANSFFILTDRCGKIKYYLKNVEFNLANLPTLLERISIYD